MRSTSTFSLPPFCFSNELIDVGVRRLDRSGLLPHLHRFRELPFPRQQHALHHPRKRVVRLDGGRLVEGVARDHRRCRAPLRASPWRRGSTPRPGTCRGSPRTRPAPSSAPLRQVPAARRCRTRRALRPPWRAPRACDRPGAPAPGPSARSRSPIVPSAFSADARTIGSGSSAAPISEFTIAGVTWAGALGAGSRPPRRSGVMPPPTNDV